MSRARTQKKSTVGKSRKSRGRGVLVFAAILVVVALAAVYVLSQPQHQPGNVGEPAPDFSMRVVTADGLSDETVQLSSLQGKVVVLEFMVSWCPVCQQMAPTLEYLAEQYRDQDVVFLSVAGTQQGATAESTAEFIRHYNATWTYVLDEDNSVFAKYKVDSTPTFFVLDRSGKILSRFQGIISTDTFAKAIDLALAA